MLAAQRSAGIPILDLTVSNPTQVLPHYPHAHIARVSAAISDFSYRPHPLGEPQARRAVVSYYAARQIAVSEDRIVLTASTSEAYSLLFKLFCDPGDEAVVPVPSYPLFEYLAALDSVRTAPYRLQYDGSWHVDFNSLHQQISDRTRAIVVVNPNNPTGSHLKLTEAERLLSVARERGLPVICDEVFADYPLEESIDCVKTLAESDSGLSFSLGGLSKTAGMPQMKLGWIVINGAAAERALAAERLELILDTYLSVSTPVQRMLPDLLSIGESIRQHLSSRIKSNLETAHRLLKDTPAQCLRTEGGWCAIIRLPAIYSDEIWTARLLTKCSVAVQPGYFFDISSEAHIVVSLITLPEVFADGIGRIRQLVLK
jgi:alanine-synthesizing transaminase